MVHIPPVSEGFKVSESSRVSSNSSSRLDCGSSVSRKKQSSDFPARTRTVSYDKHFLSHTDTTGGGFGTSYPHQKDFAWNLLFLKQSWGIGKNAPKKNAKAEDILKDKKSSKRSTEKIVQSSEKSLYTPSRAKSDLGVTLPPLSREERSKGGMALSRKDRKRRLTASERAKTTLDSIPENEPLSTSRRNTTDGQNRKIERIKRTESKHSAVSSRHRKRSTSSRPETQSSINSTSSSLRSGVIPGMNSEAGSRAATGSSRVSSSSYGTMSRISSMSGSTRWDEHEGRPLHDKLSKNNSRGESAVNCTIKSETLQKLVRAASDSTTARHTAPHLESPGVSYSFNRSLQMGRHQPFTNLNFSVENAASKTRLRSSLYKPEADVVRPTIFRSNKDKLKPPKSFNPQVHGEITRYKMVHRHAHKSPPESLIPTKWVASNEKTTGPWAKYERTF